MEATWIFHFYYIKFPSWPRIFENSIKIVQNEHTNFGGRLEKNIFDPVVVLLERGVDRRVPAAIRNDNNAFLTSHANGFYQGWTIS